MEHLLPDHPCDVRFRNNVGKCGNLSQDLKDRYLGEALFLRGYYYFLLLRQYGPVVLIKQQMSNDTDFGNMPRSPFDECAAYVCELMDRAERLLPTPTPPRRTTWAARRQPQRSPSRP